MELVQANLDAAEALAREVQQMRVTFGQREDSANRVLEDIDKARKDAKTMLQASRAALRRGELDRAEQYARSADRLASAWTFTWGDSPSKALKDIQTARANSPRPTADAQRTTNYAVNNSNMNTMASALSANTEKAHQLIRQGRQALVAGDLVQARKAAEQAAVLKADLHWSDDNPARLLDDIARADSSAKSTPSTPTSAPAIRTKEEAAALLQKGREQLHKGDIDEAVKTAARLRAARHIHWGLFEDTPDKLQGEVDRARVQRDKKQSVELLAEARKRFEKKDYDTAEKLAYEARRKHGAYSIWDLGDQPDKLLADIQTERQKQRRLKLPDPPTQTAKGGPDLSHGPLAQLDKGPMNPPTMNGSTQQPILSKDPQMAKTVMAARQLISDAKEALNRGDPMTAHVLADRVRAMHVGFDILGEDTPDSIDREVERMSAGRPRTPNTPVVQNTTPPKPVPQPVGLPSSPQLVGNAPRPGIAPAPGGDMQSAPARARQMVADARRLMQQNRLIEAHDKIEEARWLGVTFRPDEENPNHLYQQVASLARQRIDSLVRHAGEIIRAGTQAPALRCQEADKDLAQARQLAQAFGQDMQPIENTVALVNQLRGSGGVSVVGGPSLPGMLPPPGFDRNSTAAPNPMGGSTQRAHAAQLLEQARTELRNGQTATARHMAEEACNCGAREEGLAVLRSIDTEEFNQRRLRANHAFDAVVSSFNRRDYRQAGLLLAALDTTQLDERRSTKLHEIMNTPEMQPSAHGQVVLTGGQDAKQPHDNSAGPQFNPQLNPQPILHTPGAGDAGRARATDNADQSLLAHARAMREVKFQQLRQQGMDVQTQALERFRSGQTDSAIDMLQDHLIRLSEEQLEPGQLTLLRRPVQSRLDQFKIMKAQVDFANQAASSHNENKKRLANLHNAEQMKQKNVASLMKQYNELYKSAKYAEAEAIAMRVKELDPDNPMATAAVTIARTSRRKLEYDTNKSNKEKLVLEALNDTDKQGNPDAIKSGIAFETDPERRALIQGRKSLDTLHMPRKTTAEREIERKLNSPVRLNFTNAKLSEVLDDLRAYEAVNIYVDDPALAEKGITQDQRVSIKLDNVAMKSALNLLLRSVHLTYVIDNDVLQITTEDHARGKNERRVFPVTDLVIAVENFSSADQSPAEQLRMQTINQPGARRRRR